MAWFSFRTPNLVHAFLANSAASPMELPSFPPSGPFEDELKVLTHIRPRDERYETGLETWYLVNVRWGEVVSWNFERTDSRCVPSDGCLTAYERVEMATRAAHASHSCPTLKASPSSSDAHPRIDVDGADASSQAAMCCRRMPNAKCCCDQRP